jgi:hypothetical protein
MSRWRIISSIRPVVHPSIRPVHPSYHGLFTPTGRRKQWSTDMADAYILSTISTYLMLMVLGMPNSWEDFVLYLGVFSAKEVKEIWHYFPDWSHSANIWRLPSSWGNFMLIHHIMLLYVWIWPPWASFTNEKNHRFKGVWYIFGFFMAI